MIQRCENQFHYVCIVLLSVYSKSTCTAKSKMAISESPNLIRAIPTHVILTERGKIMHLNQPRLTILFKNVPIIKVRCGSFRLWNGICNF